MTLEEALQACTVEGFCVYPPKERIAPDVYAQMKDRILKIGGKWKGGKKSCFEFTSDPTELLAEIAGGARRNLKKETQFYATPSVLADRMVALAEIVDNDIVLEPSAGEGAILDAILRQRTNCVDVEVFYCEKSIDRIRHLNSLYANKAGVYALQAFNDDFLELKNPNQYTKIIANPPFAKNQDIHHIYKMYEVCAPEGRIVTCASMHWVTSTNKKEVEFRAWLHDVGARREELPQDTFKKSGANVRACLITIDKK